MHRTDHRPVARDLSTRPDAQSSGSTLFGACSLRLDLSDSLRSLTPVGCQHSRQSVRTGLQGVNATDRLYMPASYLLYVSTLHLHVPRLRTPHRPLDMTWTTRTVHRPTAQQSQG